MSWEDNIAALQAQGLDHVAFYGTDAGWLQASANSNISGPECKTIVANMAQPANFQMAGIRCAGQKYMFLSGTPDGTVIRGKQGKGGIHCAKSKTVLIVGIYGEDLQPGTAAVAIENFAAHLEKSGM
jgi:profilin